MFTIHRFDNQIHYDLICSWWLEHSWPCIPLDMLPVENGLLCYYNDKPVCSGFIYNTGTSIAWLEWLLCDPQAPKSYRSDAIDYLIKALELLAKENEATVVFTSVVSKPLIRRLDKHNYSINDTGMTNLTKVL